MKAFTDFLLHAFFMVALLFISFSILDAPQTFFNGDFDIALQNAGKNTRKAVLIGLAITGATRYRYRARKKENEA